MKSIITSILLAVAFTASAQSPKGAEQLRTQKAPAADKSNVDGKFPIFSSHIKSLGTIGKTDRYEIVSARIRGLDSPNVSALLVYDRDTDTIGSIASGVEPGLGVAIVNGAATVGGNFLFGSNLRPDRTSVSNNSESEGSSAKSTSEGGNSAAISKSEGGDAVSVSSSKSDSDASSASIAASSSTSSVKNSNSNSNKNSNSNHQSQGQVQGQQQGQSSVNANNNNANTNTKAPKAPKTKKPKKTKKH